MLKKNKRGQSTLEYIILVTAVIAVILGLVFGSASPFRAGLNSTYAKMLNSTNVMSSRLANTIN
jgi:uncharacterized protein (UPF0333 family)